MGRSNRGGEVTNQYIDMSIPRTFSSAVLRVKTSLLDQHRTGVSVITTETACVDSGWYDHLFDQSQIHVRKVEEGSLWHGAKSSASTVNYTQS